MSEYEFLRREIGVEWTRVTASELRNAIRTAAQSGGRTAIVMSDVSLYSHVLASAPAGAVVVILVSDEAYRPSALRLAREQSVAAIFRNYSVHPAAPMLWLFAVTGFLRESRDFGVSWWDTLRLLKTGLAIGARVRRWHRDARVPVTEFPLGYTNMFCHAATSLSTTPSTTGSLFDLRLAFAPERGTLVSFSGQLGQPQRQVGLALARRLPNSDVQWTTGSWGGGGTGAAGVAYVKLLCSSRFALCPPGAVSNESFRTCEAAICGALPVGLSTCISQGAKLSPWERHAIDAPSWTQALAAMESLSDADRATKTALYRDTLREETSRIGAAIRGLCGQSGEGK